MNLNFFIKSDRIIKYFQFVVFSIIWMNNGLKYKNNIGNVVFSNHIHAG